MKNKYHYPLMLITLIFLVSCSGESIQEGQKKEKINAKVEIAKMNPQAQQLSYSGKVEASHFATLSTRISGNILSIKVDAGQQVKKGDLLIAINNSDLQAQKAQIKAAQSEAKAAFEAPTTFVKIDDYDFLKAHNVPYLVPWIMPEGNNIGSAKINNENAISQGLTFRDLKQTIKDTHDWWYSEALTDDQRNKFELKPESVLLKEKSILRDWKKLNQ